MGCSKQVQRENIKFIFQDITFFNTKLKPAVTLYAFSPP